VKSLGRFKIFKGLVLKGKEFSSIREILSLEFDILLEVQDNLILHKSSRIFARSFGPLRSIEWQKVFRILADTLYRLEGSFRTARLSNQKI